LAAQNAGYAEKAASSDFRSLTLHATRSSPLDLEVGGEINGVPAGSTRYLTRGDLLALTQTNSYVSDDPNFANTVQIGGVPLEELAKRLARVGDSPLVVAICDDTLPRALFPRIHVGASSHPGVDHQQRRTGGVAERLPGSRNGQRAIPNLSCQIGA